MAGDVNLNRTPCEVCGGDEIRVVGSPYCLNRMGFDGLDTYPATILRALAASREEARRLTEERDEARELVASHKRGLEDYAAFIRDERTRLERERDEAMRLSLANSAAWGLELTEQAERCVAAEARAERLAGNLRTLTQAADRALRRAYEATKGQPTGDKAWDAGASEVARYIDARIHEELDDWIAAARAALANDGKGETSHG